MGNSIKNNTIYIGKLSTEEKSLLQLENDSLIIATNEVENFMKSKIALLEKKGYSLANLQLTNQRKVDNNLFSELQLKLNSKRNITDIVIVGYDKFPAGIKKAENWKGFKIEGPLDFSITGILAALSKTLADNKIPLFCVSTFDTDYILVESKYYEQAKKVLAIENTIK